MLFGATGYVGRIIAEYLARNVPTGCTWTLAGRDTVKLEALRERLAVIDPAYAALPLLHADSTDPDSLRALAESSKVVASTVGPYRASTAPSAPMPPSPAGRSPPP